jgi:hypothetical protein
MTDGGGKSLVDETAAVSAGLGEVPAKADRRGLTRVGYRIQAVIEHRHGTFTARVVDLSLHSMGIIGGEPLPVGEPVEVTIALLAASPDFTVRVSGNVVRADAAGVGIEFERVDVDSFAHLRKIVTYNSGDPDRLMGEFCDFMESRRGAGEQDPG